MKRKKVVKMLLILSAGAMLTGCGGNTIRETGGAISALQDANAYVTEHQAGLNEYFDALEAERKEATVERREDAVLSGSGVGTVSSDPNASLYETFTSEMNGFVGDPDTITLHVMEKEGSRFDTDSREIDLRDSLLLFLMNDTDHEVMFEVDGVPGVMACEGIYVDGGMGCYFAPGDYMTEDGEVTIRRMDESGNQEAERTIYIAL